MPKQTPRWGLLYFCVSPALAAGIIALHIAFAPSFDSPLYRTAAPVAGVTLSLAAFLAGHFSYPRVHNLKVYLAGYVTGLTGLGYFALFSIPQRQLNAINILFLIIAVNFFLIIAVPSFVKYRVTKQATFSVLVIESALLLLFRLVPQTASWASWLSRDGIAAPPIIIATVWICSVLALTITLQRHEFSLGGILSGTALLYALAWLSPLFAAQSRGFETLAFVAAPLYLDIGIVVHSLARMDHRISYDPLLHIYNRTFCTKIIEEQSNINSTPPFGVAMVDIDHFKKVNDTHGHQAGDAILYSVAQTIQRETVPDGIACRYGGEEIAIFFPRRTAKETSTIMERVRAAVEQAKTHFGTKKLSVTISCGVSCRDSALQSLADVIQSADKALYRAKKAGRNRVKAAKTRS